MKNMNLKHPQNLRIFSFCPILLLNVQTLFIIIIWTMSNKTELFCGGSIPPNDMTNFKKTTSCPTF